MSYARILLIIVAGVSITIESFGQENIIRFNGLYQKLMSNDTSYYLRFFPDGQVIGALSYGGQVENLRSWFNYENKERFDRGFYIIERTSLKIVFRFLEGDNMLIDGLISSNGDLILKEYYYQDGEVRKRNSTFFFQSFK